MTLLGEDLANALAGLSKAQREVEKLETKLKQAEDLIVSEKQELNTKEVDHSGKRRAFDLLPEAEENVQRLERVIAVSTGNHCCVLNKNKIIERSCFLLLLFLGSEEKIGKVQRGVESQTARIVSRNWIVAWGLESPTSECSCSFSQRITEH